MNIFRKITLKTMIKSPTRTIVTIIGVILSAAMITAVATFAFSLQNYMIKGSTVKYGDWHVKFLNVKSSFIEKEKCDDKVLKIASFENIGYEKFKGIKTKNKPYLFITGFTKETFAALPVTLISGRLPKNSGEVIVPSHLKIKGGVRLSLGDTLTLNLQKDIKDTIMPKINKRYKVVGTCERPSFEEHSSPGYTLITIKDKGNTKNSFTTFVTLKNPKEVHTYGRDKFKNKGYIFNDNVLRFMGLSNDNIFNRLLYSIGGVLTILIMIGSIFLIYNSFNISLNERIQQFGILSSVGATPKQLRDSVLFEGLCIGAIGIPIGIITGIGSINVVISVVASNFKNLLYSTVPLTLKVSPLVIIIGIVATMVTILISAYIPAQRAAKTPVMECISQRNEIKIEIKDIKTSKFSEYIYGLEGTLALKNFKRNKKPYRSIVLSLTLSVVLFVSASSFGTHLNEAAKKAVFDNDYDICFSTEGMDEKTILDLYYKFKTVDGIYKSSYQSILKYSCKVKEDTFSKEYKKYGDYKVNKRINLPLDIQFIEDSEYINFIKTLGLPKDKYTGDNSKMIAVAKGKKVEDKKNGKIKLINMFKSSSMNFTLSPYIDGKVNTEKSKNINITFVDTIPIDTLPQSPSNKKSYTFMIVAPYSLKDKFITLNGKEHMGLTFKSKNPSKSVAKMDGIIKGSRITSDYTLYNVHKILEQNHNIIFVVNLFTYVFVIMISLIGTFNVFNTISTNIRLRRRELAMIRSIGMGDCDFKKMMNFECAFYGIKTLLFGLPIGVIISWLIYRGLVIGGADIDFIFPFKSILISILAVFFIVFITMMYSLSKIKKENIIDGLRDDLT